MMVPLFTSLIPYQRARREAAAVHSTCPSKSHKLTACSTPGGSASGVEQTATNAHLTTLAEMMHLLHGLNAR